MARADHRQARGGASSRCWLDRGARLAASLDDGAFRRTIAHVVHRCLRMAEPGYGRTLGEALVSQGLAGQAETIVTRARH